MAESYWNSTLRIFSVKSICLKSIHTLKFLIRLLHFLFFFGFFLPTWPYLYKACKIQVGLRNNFHLAGWDLGSLCVQVYHVILLNSRPLHPEFENELRKSACLSSFSKGWEGFVICLSCQLNYLQEIK